MSHALELFRQKLKEKGLSDTGPRLAVFEALLASDHEPMTMNQLIKATAAKADRASIYRTVKVLEDIGVVRRLNIGWKYKLELSDDFHGHHHHISCIKCGKTHATHDEEYFEELLSSLSLRHGYVMTDHQLDIRGICRDCQKLEEN